MTAEIVMMPLKDIHPYEKNPRHNDASVDAVANSIRDFGFRAPILVDRDGVIIAGHTRYKAAKKLKLKTAPVVVCGDMTPEQAEAYRIADNSAGSASEWDYDLLGDILPTLDFDMADYGLDIVLGEEGDDSSVPGEVIEDEPPEPDLTHEATVKRGEVWQLGNHRIMCGDSTNGDDMAKLMDGTVADITFTSPPYNVGHMDIEKDGTVQDATKKKYLHSDDNDGDGHYTQFLIDNMRILLSSSREVFYNVGLFAGSKAGIVELLHEYANNFKDIIYWKKNTVAPHIQKGVMSSKIELILAFGADNNTRSFAIGDVHYFDGVIEGNNGAGNEYAGIHKSTFPVYLPAEIVTRFTEKNGTVLDCFGGTGTTLIACEQVGRICYMMEMEPMYCDVIIKRWEEFTGNKAERVSS